MLCWQIYLCALIAGMLVAFHPLAALGTASAGLALAWDRLGAAAPRVFALLLFAAGMGLGILRAPDITVPVPDWIADRSQVEVKGMADEVEGRYDRRLRIVLRQVEVREGDGQWQPLESGLVWTWGYPSFRPQPGSEVRFRARITPVHNLANPGGWDLESYWASQGVGYRCYSDSDTEVSATPEPDEERDRLARIMDPDRKGLDQGQSVLIALLTGDRFHVDSGTSDLFARAGLAHVLARSGLHLGLVALWGAVFAWLACMIHPRLALACPRPRLAVLIAAPLVLLYAFSGQPSPSLFRALAMYGTWAVLLFMGRRNVLLDGLIIALALALAVSPDSFGDLSLTLSVAAVTGIILALKRAQPLLARIHSSMNTPSAQPFAMPRQLAAWAAGLLLVSLAAQVAVLPLVVESFGRVSPHIHLNVAALPLITFVVMPLGMLGYGLSFLPGLDAAAAWLLNGSATGLDGLILALDHLDARGGLAQLILPRLGWPGWIGYWLFLLLLLIPSRTDASPWPRRAAWILCAGLLLVPLVQGIQASRFGPVSLTVLDVGQGQSIVIDSGQGCRTLIDGGGFFSKSFDSGRDIVAPYLLLQHLPQVDTVVNSHPHRDHIRGLLYILEAFQVGTFIHNGREAEDGKDDDRLQQLLAEPLMEILVPAVGDVLDLGDGLALEVLHPGSDFTVQDENEQSLVLRLTHEGKGLALIPGDIEQSGIDDLLRRYGPDELASEVLVLPHHGSRSSLSGPLYDMVSPMAAAASCGYLNYWALPDKAVIQAFADQNIPLYTTAEHGAVTFVWDRDGGELEVWTERK